MISMPSRFDAFEEFLGALPFEHLMRKRSPQEALARWRIEADAYRDARQQCHVALLLDCAGCVELAIDTTACWVLQTWPQLALVVLGQGADAVCEWANRHGLLAMVAEGDSKETLRSIGADWVVPALAGDLLHPSLGGIVATHAARGADAVAWDWLTGERNRRKVSVVTRHRAPWRDGVAELRRDQRGRAFAVPARNWRGHPVDDAWRSRMSHAAMGARVHPEPMGIYPQQDWKPGIDPALAEAEFGKPFEASQDFLRPIPAARGVSVVVLYRDRVDLTLRALKSVLAQQFAGRLQLVLVDNQSSPETQRIINEYLNSLNGAVAATVIAYDAPFNHSRQCNLGVGAATEDVLFFLNNDVELLDVGMLDELTRWSLLPEMASVGACMVAADGSPAGGGFRCRRLPGAEFNSPVEESSGVRATLPRTTVGNTFACAAVARRTYDTLGGLDEQAFPVGYNDVDFCLRAQRQGWRHVNLGQYRARHDVGASRARTDEIAQKLALRCSHPWTLVSALQEVDDEPIAIREAVIPALF